MLHWIILLPLVVPAQGQQIDRCRPANVIECPEHFYATPSTPSLSVKADISRAIQNALDARFNRVKVEYDLAKLDVYLQTPALDPDKRTPDELAAAAVHGRRARKAAEDEEYKRFNAAIALALPAYNLTPPQTSIPDSPRGKETNPWKPSFSKLEQFDEKTRRWQARTDEEIGDEAAEAERTVVRVGGKDVTFGVFAAQTWPDGRISMHWLAFVRSAGNRRNPHYVPDPDALAGLIAHETVHWVMSQGRRNDFSSQMDIFFDYSVEAAAYAAQANLLQQQGNPAAADFFDYSNQYSAQARQVKEMSSNVTWDEIKRLHPDWLPVGGHGAALRPGVPAPVEPGEVDGLEWAREHSRISFTESLGSLATRARTPGPPCPTGAGRRPSSGGLGIPRRDQQAGLHGPRRPGGTSPPRTGGGCRCKLLVPDGPPSPEQGLRLGKRGQGALRLPRDSNQPPSAQPPTGRSL
ncbi:MAG: hypothetical protein FD126_703 [Elusimicrobia bacterium]|nr:MAG: hypothetical protein FD126_703 [Elusimicrobiota bacterium]